MASIQSVIVSSDTGGTDRRLTFLITLLDNDGDQHVIRHGPVVADASFDAAAAAQEIADRKLAEMASQEEAGAEEAIESGDALGRVTGAKWTESKRIARALILHMVRSRDPRIVVALEPLIQYLQASYTAVQMAEWLGLTVPQILKINRRVNAILNSTGTVKNLLTAFDAEQDEFA